MHLPPLLLHPTISTLSVAMPSHHRFFAIAALVISLCALSGASLLSSKRREPTLYLFGDSTMATCRYGPVYSTNTAGWGTPLAAYMSIPVVNKALSGWSSRQAYREKLYDDVLATAQPGDIAIIQWGRNDANSPSDGTRRRPCDPVNGDFDTVCKGASSDEPAVYTFVKYLEMATKALQAKGVHVIIASLTTKSTFQTPDGQFQEEVNHFVDWAKTAAERSGAEYIDMHSSMTHWFKRLGANKVKEFYLPVTPAKKPDFTHTTLEGAEAAARSFLAALSHTNSPLKPFVKSTPSRIVQPECGS